MLITGHIRNLIINGEDVLRNFGYLCLEGFEKVNVGPVSATQRKNDVWIRNGRDVGGVKHQIFVARDVFT